MDNIHYQKRADNRPTHGGQVALNSVQPTTICGVRKLLQYGLLLWPLTSVATPVQHTMSVRFDLEAGALDITTTLTVGAERCFTLQTGLQPQLGGQTLVATHVGAERSRYCLPEVGETFTLDYAGVIRRPVIPVDGGIAPISPQGVYLDPSSGWYPDFAGALLIPELTVYLPADWRSVSQGARRERHAGEAQAVDIWQEPQPQTGLYLIATEFYEYAQSHRDDTTLLALLRADDPALAARYLEATAEYLELYSALIGDYPYAKFALVENFWESGYGMPSFTLLGPRVLRLPFILHSAYPHEILHSWWGNSVYIDHAHGNWSEGLTTYLADYLLQEQRGQGRDYRRNALQRYRNTVTPERAFPLAEFTARRDGLSQAVGYDKGMMVFHYLRRLLGDEQFIAGLRHFYAQHIFQRAGFDGLRQSFSVVSGLDLAGEFDQWVQRSDLPALQLSELAAQPDNDQWQVDFTVTQTQAAAPYHLQVPVVVQLAGEESAWHTRVHLTQRQQRFSVTVPQRPQRLAIDPDFDLPRRLAATETAPVLSQLMGSTSLLMVLPRDAHDGYRNFAARWAARDAVQVVMDHELEALPDDVDLWIIGWNNRWRPQVLAALAEHPVELDDPHLRLPDSHHAVADTSVVLIARHPQSPQRALALLAGQDPEGVDAMSRRLRHYGRYSYLAFTGAAADNSARGQWSVEDSPLDQTVSADSPPWSAQRMPERPLWPR